VIYRKGEDGGHSAGPDDADKRGDHLGVTWASVSDVTKSGAMKLTIDGSEELG